MSDEKKAPTRGGNNSWLSSHARYIRSIVFGGLDGIVTTFVIVAGVEGASLSIGVLLIIGIGSMLGDAISMGIGDYASSHAELEYYEVEKERQAWIFDNNPSEERHKIVHVYQSKGLTHEDACTVADILTKKKETAVELMMLAEHGAFEHAGTPATKGLYTFSSFLFFGFVPLVTYVISPFFDFTHDQMFASACLLTGVTLFALGAAKGTVIQRNWFYSGLEMLTIGGGASVVAYVIGYLLRGLA